MFYLYRSRQLYMLEIVHLNGLKGWSVWSVLAVSGFAGDPTSLARNNPGGVLTPENDG